MDNMLPMLYETIFGFIALFVLTKVLGKTQISQLTAFDFIAALVLGELVGNALFDDKAGVLDIAYVVFLWGSLLYIVELITQKYKGSRFLLEGKPTMIIYEGKFVYEEMRKNKVDVGEIQHLLRMKDVFSVQEVEYAILETNGDVSVLKKAAFQTPNVSELQVKQKKPEIAMTIITDGELIEDNLDEAGITRKWVKEEVNKQYIDHIYEVFYAEYKDEKLYVLPYFKIKEKHYNQKLKRNSKNEGT